MSNKKEHPIFLNSLMFVEGVGRFWEYIHRWTSLYTSESDLEGRKYQSGMWAYM